jgi:hypothetical protein
LVLFILQNTLTRASDENICKTEISQYTIWQRKCVAFLRTPKDLTFDFDYDLEIKMVLKSLSISY